MTLSYHSCCSHPLLTVELLPAREARCFLEFFMSLDARPPRHVFGLANQTNQSNSISIPSSFPSLVSFEFLRAQVRPTSFSMPSSPSPPPPSPHARPGHPLHCTDILFPSAMLILVFTILDPITAPPSSQTPPSHTRLTPQQPCEICCSSSMSPRRGLRRRCVIQIESKAFG